MKYGRSMLRDVEGYVPGEQPKMLNIIKLNTNENPYPPSPHVLEALQKLDAHSIRRYPDPLSLALREACARRFGYDSADWIVVGNGMDEILAMTMRTFVDPDDIVSTTYPTYTLYETLAQLHGANIIEIDLDEQFQLTEAFMQTPARLAFLPRPNAPSGVAFPKEQVAEFCKHFNGLVFIDEAYADFSDDNCMDLPKRFDNVIIGRTFSKSFSLAGLRIGLAVARPEVIAEYIKTKDSYNMDAACQAAGLAAFTDYEYMLANVQKVRATRARLMDALKGLGFCVPPSQSNFVFAQWNGAPSAKVIFERLRERAIIVRYFDSRRIDNALRISVGTDEEIDMLLNAIRQILGKERT